MIKSYPLNKLRETMRLEKSILGEFARNCKVMKEEYVKTEALIVFVRTTLEACHRMNLCPS